MSATRLQHHDPRERLNLDVHRYQVIADGDTLYFSDIICAAATAHKRRGVLLRPDGGVCSATECFLALISVEHSTASRETKIAMVMEALRWPVNGHAAVKEVTHICSTSWTGTIALRSIS